MALYKLWRQADNETFHAEAADPATAIVAFSEQLGIKLSLQGPAAPQYLMGPVRQEPGWAPPPDIDVFEVPE